MSFLEKLAKVATGGLVTEVAGLVRSYLPPDMTPQQKAELEEKLAEVEARREAATNEAIADAERAVNERIKIYEGTASDLQAVPVLGPLMLFLRGGQRIVWGYGALWLDWLWFTDWSTLSERQEAALVAINVLVLGFLFGERAIKNVMPLITKLFEARR